MRYALALLCLVLVGCQAPPKVEPGAQASYQFPRSVYADAERSAVYEVDTEASTVRVLVYRGGALASSGHNHVMVPRQLRGAVYLPTDDPDAARADIEFALADLAVDPPAARRAIGGSFASEVSDDARAGTRENMLGTDGLDADRFPRVGLRVRIAGGELPAPVLRVAVYLHGRVNEYLVPARVSVDDGTLRAEGRFALRQSAFGIEPFSALGGALRVQDWVTVAFDLRAQNTSK